jgi:hypothetical protein
VSVSLQQRRRPRPAVNRSVTARQKRRSREALELAVVSVSNHPQQLQRATPDHSRLKRAQEDVVGPRSGPVCVGRRSARRGREHLHHEPSSVALQVFSAQGDCGAHATSTQEGALSFSARTRVCTQPSRASRRQACSRQRLPRFSAAEDVAGPSTDAFELRPSLCFSVRLRRRRGSPFARAHR